MRRAGGDAANSDTSGRPDATTANVLASSETTPESTLPESALESAQPDSTASVEPVARPMTVSVPACRRVSASRSYAVTPRAMRMPIAK